MKTSYIIKQHGFGEHDSYFLSLTKNVSEFIEQKEYAHEFRTKREAQQMIAKIIKVTPLVGALTAERTERAVCAFDCFHCPFPDCKNTSAAMTDWERQAVRIGRAGLYEHDDDEEN